MLNYLEQLERERRRRTLQKLARNCGSVKQARTMILISVLSPEMRVVYQLAIRNSATPVYVGARCTVPEEQLGTIHRAPTLHTPSADAATPLDRGDQ